jgi:DNA-3-methyladenine glycosylase II
MPTIVAPEDLDQLMALDPLFGQIHDQYGPPPNWSRPPGFVSLCQIILEQQVSLASAKAHFRRLEAYMGTVDPLNLLRLTDEEMRSCQVSRQKATYLRALSRAVADQQLDLGQLAGLPPSEVRQQLTRLKGIGDWTTDIYLMFCLQAKDIFPLGDIALVNTIKELTEARTRDEIRLVATKWQPLRSLAAYFLWHYYLKKRNRPSE